MISLQRRLERYQIVYVWKILEGRTLSCGISASTAEGRKGRMCQVPKINTKSFSATQTLKEQTFKVNGPKLFNCQPVYQRNTTKCPLDEFKGKLNKYLETIPDKPSVSGLTPAGCTADTRPSNSILDQAKQTPGRGERGPGC
jgi:hypothetical protein